MSDDSIEPEHFIPENTIAKQAIIRIICFGIPILLLVCAYIHMAIHYERLWLFNTIVHENGKYTLLEVIFYFRHFLWEAPIKISYAIFLVGLFFFYGNPISDGNIDHKMSIPNYLIVLGFFIALIIVGIAFVFAADQFGFHEALNGLLQYRRSENSALMFGSHWRNHFLSNIVLFSTSACCIILFRTFIGHGKWTIRRPAKVFYVGAALFVLATIFFQMNLDPFTIPSYLGHQLREIFGTDLSITMLLSLGLLFYLESRYDVGSKEVKTDGRVYTKKALYLLAAWGIPAMAATLFLIIQILNLNIGSEMAKLSGTQNWTKIDLFAWHFYEHSLDYIFILLLVGSLYLLALRIEMHKHKAH